MGIFLAGVNKRRFAASLLVHSYFIIVQGRLLIQASVLPSFFYDVNHVRLSLKREFAKLSKVDVESRSKFQCMETLSDLSMLEYGIKPTVLKFVFSHPDLRWWCFACYDLWQTNCRINNLNGSSNRQPKSIVCNVITLCGPIKETGVVMTALFILLKNWWHRKRGKDIRYEKDVNLSVTQTTRNSRILDRNGAIWLVDFSYWPS